MAFIIDGKLYRQLILAGANRVIGKQEELNKINVFPVPDGDTGSNMAYTLSNIAQAAEQADIGTGLGRLTQLTADAALSGALGNSGSILAQFFQGIQKGLEKEAAASLALFATTLASAGKLARDAIQNPVEGTIITVMYEWGGWIEAHHAQYEDLQGLVSDSLASAQKSLAETPEKLAILSQNHVVDAGAQGFVHFLQGIHDFLMIGHIDKVKTASFETLAQSEAILAERDEDIHLTAHKNDLSNVEDLINQYCTECIIHGTNLNIKAIRAEMSRWGNSLVVVGNDHKVKVHIHTNAPERVFRRGNDFGDVLETKADDMWAQYRAAQQIQHNKHIAILTDSACSLPQAFFVRHNVIIMPLQVLINNQPHLDGVNITRAAFLKHLCDNNTQVSTSQAPLPDMKAAFEKGLRQSDALIMIPISSRLSGTYNGLKRLCEYYSEDVRVVDSKNAAAGQGLVVMAAVKAVQAGKNIEEVTKIAETIADNTYQFISPRNLKYAVKGGRVKRSTGTMLDLLHIKPILAVNKAGEIIRVALSFGTILSRRKMLRLAIKAAVKMKKPMFCLSHVEAEKEARQLAALLQKRFKLRELPPVAETTPVITTHIGPGSLSIAVADEHLMGLHRARSEAICCQVDAYSKAGRPRNGYPVSRHEAHHFEHKTRHP